MSNETIPFRGFYPLNCQNTKQKSQPNRNTLLFVLILFNCTEYTMSEIEALEREIVALRRQLEEKENALNELRSKEIRQVQQKLTKEEIGRYARQIILPEIGVKGQLALKNASVLVVGAGGLGILHFQFLILSQDSNQCIS